MTRIINEVRLKIKLKLFLIKTPIIRIEKTDKDKKISGNIIFKLSIIWGKSLTIEVILESTQPIISPFELINPNKNARLLSSELGTKIDIQYVVAENALVKLLNRNSINQTYAPNSSNLKYALNSVEKMN